jgi:hypothetical protein
MPRELPPPMHIERLRATLDRWGVRRHWECWHPLIVGVTLGSVMLFVRITDQQAEKINSAVLPLAVSVAAILAGFQGAMHAIFLAVIRTKTVRYLREKNAYQSLMRYIRSGVVSLVAFVAVAMFVITAASLDLMPSWYRFTYGLLVAIFTFSLLAGTRIMMLLLRLLQHADD